MCFQAAAAAPAPKKQQLAGGRKGAGFSDHNAKWLKPKPQAAPSGSSEEEEEGSELEGEQSLSGEEFSSDGGSEGALGSEGEPRSWMHPLFGACHCWKVE